MQERLECSWDNANSGDQRKVVVDGFGERHRAKLHWETGTACDRTGRDRIAEATGGELQRTLRMLNVEVGEQRDTRFLCACRELTARWIGKPSARVVEDKPLAGHIFDADRALGALWASADKQDLVAEQGLDFETLRIDGQDNDCSLKITRPNSFRDR